MWVRVQHVVPNIEKQIISHVTCVREKEKEAMRVWTNSGGVRFVATFKGRVFNERQHQLTKCPDITRVTRYVTGLTLSLRMGGGGGGGGGGELQYT